MRRIGGWWRLWIALSAVWIIVMICISIAVLRDSRQPDALRRTNVEVNCKGYVGGTYIDLIDATDPKADLFRQLKAPSPPKGYELVMSDEAAKFVAQCREAKAHDYESDSRKQMRQTAIEFSLAASLPPLCLLGLGLLISWIGRGFRIGKDEH